LQTAEPRGSAVFDWREVSKVPGTSRTTAEWLWPIDLLGQKVPGTLPNSHQSKTAEPHGSAVCN